jgi:hypothetical protein
MSHDDLAMGASPDALLEGADELVGPGGVVVEVKCPFGGGAPRAYGRMHARHMPQVQGLMLATRRAMCHFVSWSPSGATVFGVHANESYQHAMVQALTAAASAAHDGRELSADEEAHAALVRSWSRQLALDASLVAYIDAARCVALLDEPEGAPSFWDDASGARSTL